MVFFTLSRHHCTNIPQYSKYWLNDSCSSSANITICYTSTVSLGIQHGGLAKKTESLDSAVYFVFYKILYICFNKALSVITVLFVFFMSLQQ